MSEEFSGMTYADIMDDIFARSKSFSGKEYYDEMVRICPELKKKMVGKDTVRRAGKEDGSGLVFSCCN